MSNAGHVSGKVAVVTGGARGMGAAHVRALAREGAVVAGTDIIDDLGASLAEQSQSEGRDVSYYHHDVTSRAGWEAVVASAQQAHGPIDVLVNKAGVQVRSMGPAASLVGSYELLAWLVRTSRALERQPSAEHRCDDTVCRAAARSALTINSGQHSRNNRDLSARGWQTTIQAAGQAATTASAQHADGVPGAGADNDAAVAAYRLSVKAGSPLFERKLAQMFGRTSRRWARARIAQARQSP